MKTHWLIPSALLNLTLIGAVTFLWETRTPPTPAMSMAAALPSAAPPLKKSLPSLADLAEPALATVTPEPPFSLPLSAPSLPPEPSFQAPTPPLSNEQAALAANHLQAPVRSARPVDSNSTFAISADETQLASNASERSPYGAVDSSRPGNFFRANGVRVAVAETIPPSGATAGPALGIDLTPSAPESSSDATAAENLAGQNSPGQGSAAVSNQSSRNRNESLSAPSLSMQSALAANSDSGDSSRSGLTREQELFRAKWGWAAYDAALTEARLAAGK